MIRCYNQIILFKRFYVEMNATLFRHHESKILFLGIALALGLVAFLLFLALFAPPYFKPFISITFTNIIFGRIAGLSIGIGAQIDTTLLVLFNFFIESIMVLISYPLFVLSLKKLDIISIQFLKDFLQKSQNIATKYQPLIKKYGVMGLVLFVLTPFAMTGPVVGSFVGFLIGFKHRTTLFIVLLSTLIGTIMWMYLIKNFEEQLIGYSQYLMQGVFIATIGVVAWFLVRKYLKRDSSL